MITQRRKERARRRRRRNMACAKARCKENTQYLHTSPNVITQNSYFVKEREKDRGRERTREKFAGKRKEERLAVDSLSLSLAFV